MNIDAKSSQIGKKPEPFASRLFSITEAPWAVTLAIGGAGWTIVRIVDTVVASPSIEYTVSTTQIDANTLQRVLHIENISRTKMFDTLEFFLGIQKGKFSSADFLPPSEPARLKGGPYADAPRLERDNQLAVFPVSQLQPGWALDLSVKQDGTTATPITVSVFSGPYERNEPESPNAEAKAKAATEAVRLVPGSVETFIVSNEVTLLSILLLAWLFLIVTFVIAKLHQSRKAETPPCTPKNPESNPHIF
jgi:hypothetical protein